MLPHNLDLGNSLRVLVSATTLEILVYIYSDSWVLVYAKVSFDFVL
jgi:hypothetical protein